jgi:nitrogen fixation/metabolism regulation signal transduction histidine kinase
LAAALLRLLQIRLGFAKCIASQHELRGRNGNGSNARAFEGGGEEARAETFAERSEAIEKLIGSLRRYSRVARPEFVEQVSTEGIELAGDAIVIGGIERKSMQNIKVQLQNGLRFDARALMVAVSKCLGNAQQAIGDALHGGDDHNDPHASREGANQCCRMQHALGA